MPLMPHITHAHLLDCETVAALAAKTFTDSFGHMYSAEDLASHLASKCSAAYFEQSLRAGSTILMAKLDGKLVGYAKVGHVELPVKPLPAGAVEIHRVYVDKAFQGQGIGKAIMLYILALPKVDHAPIVYLGVWEDNVRAQGLYTLYGFEAVGRYLYYVGTHADREIIMARQR